MLMFVQDSGGIMARQYIRPDLGPRLLDELVPAGTVLLINPTQDELMKALIGLQKRMRKNLLSCEQLRQLYEDSRQDGFFSAYVSTTDTAPQRYGFDYPSTQAAACRLGEGLIGFVLTRSLTPPGETIIPPIYPFHPGDSNFDPIAWRNGVITTFWTRLVDDELAALDRTAIEQAMINVVRRRAAEARRAQRQRDRDRQQRELDRRDERQRLAIAEQRARDQATHLFKGVCPEYATHLSEACSQIASSLALEGRASVGWGEFKKRWPSVADRYQEDLLPLVEDGGISVAALQKAQGARLFTLALSLWTGAQRLFDAPQIVFRVDAKELVTRMVESDPDLTIVVEKVRKQNCLTSRCHPVQEWTAGWLRVHVDDDNRIVFVDEIQSDTMEHLRSLAKFSAKLLSAAHTLAQALRPWNLHGFASVCRWARAIGYAVGIHSAESRHLKPGMTHSERKWNQYYEPVIKQFGLSRQSIPGYPALIMIQRHFR